MYPQNRINDRADLRLIRRIKNGSARAFKKLVETHQKRIYFTIRRIVPDHNITDDLVQDTFIKVYTKLDQYNETLPFYPWLHRIAVNAALNYLKKSSVRNEKLSIDEDVPVQIADPHENPLENIIQEEFRRQVAGALQELSKDQRVVFVLKTSEDLSYKEISERLDISIGTVMSRLSRAREKLKILLQPYLNNNDKKV